MKYFKTIIVIVIIGIISEINALADRGNEPVYKAVATTGEGVLESFLGLIDLTWERLNAWHDLEGKFQIDGALMRESLKKQLYQTVS